MQDFIIKYRLWIISVAIAITLGSLYLIPSLKVNANVSGYVPDTIKYKVYLKQLDSIFGGSEMILLMLHSEDVVTNETLTRLQNISLELEELEGLDRIISPFTAQDVRMEDGYMIMNPFFAGMPYQASQYPDLKRRIEANIMTNKFFSNDFSLVSLVLVKNTNAPDLIIDKIKEISAKYPGKDEVILGGLPFIRYSIEGNIMKDLIFLLPLAMILMVCMLYFSFREWKGVFMPFVIVLMSIILSFGLMSFLGWQISLFSIIMPIMIIAIANDYGIHLIAHYQELARTTDLNMISICKKIYSDLKMPILITGITTIGGILGLLSHTMKPAAELGVLTAIAIAFALLLSLWFLPAMLSYYKPRRPESLEGANKIIKREGLLHQTSLWVSKQPKKIIISAILISVVSVFGFLNLGVDTNIENYFSEKSEVGRSTRLINEKFGGSQFISVLFTGEVLSSEVLHRMEYYGKMLEEDPGVGTVSSPVNIVKELSKGFYSPEEEGYNSIPKNSDEIYQFIEVFNMSGEEEGLSQFLDYDYKNARMIISLKDGSNSASKRIVEKLDELTKEDPNVRFAAGASLTQIELADQVVEGQIKSLLIAILIVFFLLTVIFKSVKGGLLSALPISLATAVLFGLMGIFGIDLDIATALLSSIMIGVGVDYTIHFLWRFKKERAKGLIHSEAVYNTLTTTGRGIVINALSVVIGFIPLMFSSFMPLKFFGALIVISILACLVSSLFLVPAIILLTKPKFLG
ncbi:MAG: efflux RND transporter permease subunit [Eudoraea sp.]|uniref:efflux RND transporter permease subunit n=1 Tax=Eudoraea sp. TaxID=1979955 RepID=UPI003C7854E4